MTLGVIVRQFLATFSIFDKVPKNGEKVKANPLIKFTSIFNQFFN